MDKANCNIFPYLKTIHTQVKKYYVCTLFCTFKHLKFLAYYWVIFCRIFCTFLALFLFILGGIEDTKNTFQNWLTFNMRDNIYLFWSKVWKKSIALLQPKSCNALTQDTTGDLYIFLLSLKTKEHLFSK